jgi:hypothetical protein
MSKSRRAFLEEAFAAGALGVIHPLVARASAAATESAPLGIPGPYRGRVVAVHHSSAVVSGAYQAQPIEQMIQKGMMELTSAPSWVDAWRVFARPGDVVGIKVSPVGGRKLCSDPLVLRRIIDGLNQAGVPNRDIVVFSRYRQEIIENGIDKWLPDGVRWTAPSEAYDNVQLGMKDYDPDHYMELALAQPGQNVNDEHVRRSYVAQVVTREINKFINLPVLKHHQSAGVTIALKNMSHGLVNNVCRSHSSPTLNACGIFIPSVVSLPVIRQKGVLHILDAVKASYHGGPGGNPKYIWEHNTMYFATDPVALDKTGWRVIDEMRARQGMAPVAVAKPDGDSHFLNCQVEHIEMAGALGLGEFDDRKIDVRRVSLS